MAAEMEDLLLLPVKFQKNTNQVVPDCQSQLSPQPQGQSDLQPQSSCSPFSPSSSGDPFRRHNLSPLSATPSGGPNPDWELTDLEPPLNTPDFMSVSAHPSFDEFFFSPSPQNPLAGSPEPKTGFVTKQQQQQLQQQLISQPQFHHEFQNVATSNPYNNHGCSEGIENSHLQLQPPPSTHQPHEGNHPGQRKMSHHSSASCSSMSSMGMEGLPIKLESVSPTCHMREVFNQGSNNPVQSYGQLVAKQEIVSSPSPQPDCDTSLEIYRDLILRHLVQDIGSTCAKLGILTAPQIWTPEQTLIWLQEMTAQFHLGEVPLTQLYLPGNVLCQMSKDEFLAASPQTGDTLHAQLQIWKTAADFQSMQGFVGLEMSSTHSEVQQGPSSLVTTISPDTTAADDWLATFDPSGIYSAGHAQNNNHGPLSIQTFPPPLHVLPTHNLHSPSDSDSGISADFGEDFLLRDGNASTFTARKRSPLASGTGSIHLWQFIRELLDHPDTFSQCVRWIDRTEGIFKIEDSHKLARLWGQRKNRHKMNYDKLSRSLRQYYKKNIIKKTGQRQRLIYQFIPPYHLL